MSSEAHIGGKPPAEHEHGPDWLKLLDVLVWGSALVIAILGVEWLFGVMARQSMLRGVDRLLKREAAKTE